jgi:hypothetical protein
MNGFTSFTRAFATSSSRFHSSFLNTTRRHLSSSKSSSPKPSSSSSNPVQWYSAMLESHPLLTKCLTSGFIAGAGDANCQYIVHLQQQNKLKEATATTSTTTTTPSFQFDGVRTARMAFLGAALLAPVIHHWYGFLMTRIPGVSIAATLKRTALDQLVFAPIFIPTFMVSLMKLQGRTFSEIGDALKDSYQDTLTTNWGIWVPAMLINFGFMPAKFQVLFSNTVGLGWNTYLSFKINTGSKD